MSEKQIYLKINDEKNITQPIISFDFYKNGLIKEVYIPNNLQEQLYNYLDETLNKFIPKLDANLYCKNITEELNKFKEVISEEELENNYENIEKLINDSNF